MFKNAVIIAGGFGTRMLPLTNYIPKPLVVVNDKPLIQHALDFLNRNDITNVSVTYGHKAPQLLNYVGYKVSSLINTVERDNAYFLYNSVVKYINEPIIVMPCDIIVDIDLNKLYSEYVNLNEPPICIVPIKASKDADYIHTNNNQVVKITRNDESLLCASGIQIINPHKVNKLGNPQNNFYNVWMHMINQKSLYVTNTQPVHWKAYDNLKDII